MNVCLARKFARRVEIARSLWSLVASDLTGLLENRGPSDEGKVGMKFECLFTDYFTNEERKQLSTQVLFLKWATRW